MSWRIKDGRGIVLTRGDTLRLKIGIVKDGEESTPADGDVVRFALKRDKMNGGKTEYSDTAPLVHKVIPNESLILTIAPEDTKKLGFGQYVYDVEITFASGDVATFITDAPFELTREVH